MAPVVPPITPVALGSNGAPVAPVAPSHCPRGPRVQPGPCGPRGPPHYPCAPRAQPGTHRPYGLRGYHLRLLLPADLAATTISRQKSGDTPRPTLTRIAFLPPTSYIHLVIMAAKDVEFTCF